MKDLMSRFFRYQILAGLLGYGYTSIQKYHRPYWTQVKRKQCWVAPTLTTFHAQLSGVEFWGHSQLHMEELDNSSFLRKTFTLTLPMNLRWLHMLKSVCCQFSKHLSSFPYFLENNVSTILKISNQNDSLTSIHLYRL